MGTQVKTPMAHLQEWTGRITEYRSRGMADQAWITLLVGSRAETAADLVKAVKCHA